MKIKKWNFREDSQVREPADPLGREDAQPSGGWRLAERPLRVVQDIGWEEFWIFRNAAFGYRFLYRR